MVWGKHCLPYSKCTSQLFVFQLSLSFNSFSSERKACQNADIEIINELLQLPVYWYNASVPSKLECISDMLSICSNNLNVRNWFTVYRTV